MTPCEKRRVFLVVALLLLILYLLQPVACLDRDPFPTSTPAPMATPWWPTPSYQPWPTPEGG